jgi:hypothetical protein
MVAGVDVNANIIRGSSVQDNSYAPQNHTTFSGGSLITFNSTNNPRVLRQLLERY